LTFKDQYHPAVKKDLKKLDRKAQEEIRTEWIPVILAEPYSGEELSGPLHGIRSFHLKIRSTDYRVAYIVSDEDETVGRAASSAIHPVRPVLASVYLGRA